MLNGAPNDVTPLRTVEAGVLTTHSAWGASCWQLASHRPCQLPKVNVHLFPYHVLTPCSRTAPGVRHQLPHHLWPHSSTPKGSSSLPYRPEAGLGSCSLPLRRGLFPAGQEILDLILAHDNGMPWALGGRSPLYFCPSRLAGLLSAGYFGFFRVEGFLGSPDAMGSPSALSPLCRRTVSPRCELPALWGQGPDK